MCNSWETRGQRLMRSILNFRMRSGRMFVFLVMKDGIVAFSSPWICWLVVLMVSSVARTVTPGFVSFSLQKKEHGSSARAFMRSSNKGLHVSKTKILLNEAIVRKPASKDFVFRELCLVAWYCENVTVEGLRLHVRLFNLSCPNRFIKIINRKEQFDVKSKSHKHGRTIGYIMSLSVLVTLEYPPGLGAFLWRAGIFDAKKKLLRTKTAFCGKSEWLTTVKPTFLTMPWYSVWQLVVNRSLPRCELFQPTGCVGLLGLVSGIKEVFGLDVGAWV